MVKFTYTLVSSYRSLLRRKDEWEMGSTRSAGWDATNIGPFVEALREEFPNMGAGDMMFKLRIESGVWVSKYVICSTYSVLLAHPLMAVENTSTNT